MTSQDNSSIIIAIDGYSSCGKSTLAKSLAKKIGFSYVDTGAMYRAVCLYFINEKVAWSDCSDEELSEHISRIDITFKYHADLNSSPTYLNGVMVEDEIRGREVSSQVSEVSQLKVIRSYMARMQRQIGNSENVVMDGRDIGTNVFPEAQLKIFMTAQTEIRAKRRYDELLAKGHESSFEEVLENIKKRDYNDTHRLENPLIRAEDAIEIDNSFLDRDEQMSLVLSIVKEKIGIVV